MSFGIFPFVLIPLLVYTYFWLNPTALAAFLDGFIRYITEIYLGYKAWRLEYETKKAYKYYMKLSEQIAEEKGISKKTLNKYFKVYGKEDWNFLYQREKDDFENRNREIEDNLREMILF